MKLETYQKVERILKRIKYNSDKIVRLENAIDRITNEEVKFQAQVAILHFHQKDIQGE